MVLLPHSDDLASDVELADIAMELSCPWKHVTDLSLTHGHTISIILNGLLKVLNLLLIEPRHFCSSELAHVFEILFGVNHLTFGLVTKSEA